MTPHCEIHAVAVPFHMALVLDVCDIHAASSQREVLCVRHLDFRSSYRIICIQFGAWESIKFQLAPPTSSVKIDRRLKCEINDSMQPRGTVSINTAIDILKFKITY